MANCSDASTDRISLVCPIHPAGRGTAYAKKKIAWFCETTWLCCELNRGGMMWAEFSRTIQQWNSKSSFVARFARRRVPHNHISDVCEFLRHW